MTTLKVTHPSGAAEEHPRPAPCARCDVRHRSLTSEQCGDRHMSEAVLQSRVIARARKRGWKVAHAGRAFVGDMKTGAGQFVTPMSPGWPDLTLAKAGHRLLFMELKKELGLVDDKQTEWLHLLNQTGCRAILVRPSDLRLGRVNAILSNGSPV